MEIRFVSKKPWVNADIKLKRGLMITTAIMAVIGVICAIIGVVLTVYQEYAVGIISIIVGVFIPVSYFLINVFMLAEQRKKFDKNLIVEYAFFEDRMEVVELSNNYKAKSVVNYSGLLSLKVRMRYFFLRFESESFVIRKSDVKASSDRTRAVNELMVYLNSKIRDNILAKESTCATDEVPESCEEEIEEITEIASEIDLNNEESIAYAQDDTSEYVEEERESECEEAAEGSDFAIDNGEFETDGEGDSDNEVDAYGIEEIGEADEDHADNEEDSEVFENDDLIENGIDGEYETLDTPSDIGGDAMETDEESDAEDSYFDSSDENFDESVEDEDK